MPHLEQQLVPLGIAVAGAFQAATAVEVGELDDLAGEAELLSLVVVKELEEVVEHVEVALVRQSYQEP